MWAKAIILILNVQHFHRRAMDFLLFYKVSSIISNILVEALSKGIRWVETKGTNGKHIIQIVNISQEGAKIFIKVT